MVMRFGFARTPASQADAAGLAGQAVQAHLDAQAQAWGYDSIYTVCTYAEEAEDRIFQAEGKALRAGGSAVKVKVTAADSAGVVYGWGLFWR